MKIDSQIFELPGVIESRTQNEIKNMPMLFNCDIDTASRMGGSITNEFIGLLPKEWDKSKICIDSRTHMLMPGWMPCIPGWHHDDVPRTRVDGQPNYLPGQNRSEHVMLLVGGDICPTEFAIGEAEFDIPPIGSTIYGEWHKQVELLIQNELLESFTLPSNKLFQFNDRTWHRGTVAIDNGWRFFIRASRYLSADGQSIQRGNIRSNEIRKQVQVYMPAPFQGW